MTGLLLVGVAAAVIGVLVGRWIVMPPVAATWPTFMSGLERGWWGNGVGDGWEWSLVAGTALAVAGAALGVAVRRLGARTKRLSG